MNFPNNYICAANEFTDFNKFIPAPYFRKSFFADGGSARIIISVCGFYDIYLNGKRYTRGFMSPYISNPDDIVYCDRYELPLNKGENVLGIILGNGFQNDPAGHFWDFDKAPFRSAPKFALRAEFIDENGNAAVINSDKSFRTAPSPIIFDEYRLGEHYDARLEIPHWCEPQFDDGDWGYALDAEPPKGEPRICTADPICVIKELKPKKITPAADGYCYDFGENRAGVCRLSVKGASGQKIELFHGEQLCPDGTLDRELIWMKNSEEQWQRDIKLAHRDIYICHGDGQETYTPRFTYHGFQYVLVSGITEEQATEDLLTYLVMSSADESRGDFECSDETLNKLQLMTRRSDLANLFHIPTDCPQREKNGWTADAALSADQMLLNFNAESCLAEWMHCVCKAQAENGSLPGIVPTAGWGFAWGNGPAWDSALATVPYYIYKYTGDRRIISDCADSFIKYADYLLTRRNERGLLAIGLGDWCHVGRGASDYIAPLEFTDSAFAMDTTAKCAFLLEQIGRTEDAARLKDISNGFRSALRSHLYDFDTSTAAGGCQTTQAMSVFFNILEESEKPAAVKKLVEMINEKGGHFDVGVLGARVIFYVLSQFGYTDLAIKMIKGPDFPSYGYWIENGATSLWEGFSEGKLVASRNHHFWGHISGWFTEYLAGLKVNPSAADINTADIAPHFAASLDFAAAYHIMPAGRLESRWERRHDGSIILKITAPEGVRGSIVPDNGFVFNDGSSKKPLKSGEYIIKGV